MMSNGCIIVVIIIVVFIIIIFFVIVVIIIVVIIIVAIVVIDKLLIVAVSYCLHTLYQEGFSCRKDENPEAVSAIWSRIIHICALRSVLLDTEGTVTAVRVMKSYYYFKLV